MATSEHPPDGRVVQTCLIILTLLASAAALAWLRAVLVPFLLAVFLSFFLAPLIDWQVRRLRFPAALAVATTSLLGLGLLALLGFGAAASLSTLAAQIGCISCSTASKWPCRWRNSAWPRAKTANRCG
jgi:predicted PurR-regulated permease PerM